jgi:hypothetical protein
VRRARRAAGAPEDETAVELGRLRARAGPSPPAPGKGLPLAPNARVVFERLAAHARIALVTRASRREVEFLLGLADMEGLFRPMIAGGGRAADQARRAEPWLAALARIGPALPRAAVEGARGGRIMWSGSGPRDARTSRAWGVGPLPAHEAIEGDAWIESLVDLTPERMRALTGTSTERRR